MGWVLVWCVNQDTAWHLIGGQQCGGGIKIFALVFATGPVGFWPQRPVQHVTRTGNSSHPSFLKKDTTGGRDVLITTSTYSFLGMSFSTRGLSTETRWHLQHNSPSPYMGRIPLNQFPHYPAHTGKPDPWDHHCSPDSLQGESSPPDSAHSVKQVCQFFWSAALQELLLCWKPSRSHTDPEKNAITSYKSGQIRQL